MEKAEMALLLLGSNIGDRKYFIEKALANIENEVGQISKISMLYETEAWGDEQQENYFNLAIEVQTNLSPMELLGKLQAIEKQLGRERREKWGPREIDIDILFYTDQILQSEKLVIPHPHIANRNFALVPLLDIASQFVHPQLDKTIEELYWEADDTLDVFLLEEQIEKIPITR